MSGTLVLNKCLLPLLLLLLLKEPQVRHILCTRDKDRAVFLEEEFLLLL